MIFHAIAVSLLLAAAPPASKKKPPAENNDTMKSVIKDAIKGDPPTTSADGGVAEARPGPDVSKMRFSADNIKVVVAFYAPQIQTCYEETLAAKDKAVEGKLMTSWVIAPDGSVNKPKIEKKGTTLKDPHLYDCVTAVLSAMSFPRPTDGKPQPIEYPFNLKAVQ